MGLFIRIAVDQERLGPGDVTRVVAACPVDIFVEDGGRLVVVPEREDECTLCELCLRAPQGAVRVEKLYKPETLVSRG